MSDNKSVLVSLGDSRLKEISEVIGNKTCNKILDFLTEKNATVSDIAKELGMPLNTADYNVKKLTSAGLIEKTSYFWSIKGKKMPIYKLSNKKIVISPKRTKSFMSVFLALGIMAVLALILRWNITNIDSVMVNEQPSALMADVYDRAGAISLNKNSAEDTQIEKGFLSTLESWEWFLVGAWLAILVFFVISYIDERRKTK